MLRDNLSNEEAIKCIKNILRGREDKRGKTEVDIALEMAVKALEQEPKLGKDGTLIVTTKYYKNVGRVLVQDGTNGTLFYQNDDPCDTYERGECPFYTS